MIKEALDQSLRSFREDVLELSQAQFAALVGMGVASINRIENGAEPTPAHRLLLDGLRESANLLRALEGKEVELGAANVARVRRVAEKLLGESELRALAKYQELYHSDSTSGGRRFELEKLSEMVKFFCIEGEWKTKLNKLLFYSDFLAFRESGQSISGTRYVVGTFGPIPDRHEKLYSALCESGGLEAREEFVPGSGQPVEKLYAQGQVDRRKFSILELSIMERVKLFFLGKSAKFVADYSHEEEFYKQGQLGDSISYEVAQTFRPLALSEVKVSSLGELAARAAQKVPVEAWNELPRDGAKNIDRELYGPKKQGAAKKKK